MHLYDRFFDDNCSSFAASLAYSTLLSLVPLLMVSFYVLSFFPVFKGVGHSLQEFILSNFVAGSANVISIHLNDFLKQIRVLSWTNIVALLIASVLMIYNMVHAFNMIWRVKLERHFALSFLIYLGILLATPIVFGALMLGSSYLATLPVISDVKSLNAVSKPVLFILPYTAALVTFTFFNWVLPSTKVPLRYAFVAGMVTTVFFECAKYFFTLYLSLFPTYRIIYGALATIPIFFIWIYVTWVIILLGALICNALSQ